MALIIGTALIVRIFGVIVDGTFTESLRVLIAETVLLVLCLGAYMGERLSPDISEIRRA